MPESGLRVSDEPSPEAEQPKASTAEKTAQASVLAEGGDVQSMPKK
jgi:hypothetical protein